MIAAKADSRPSPVTLAVVFHMGGAINRVDSADTAYGERSAQWMSSFDGNWEDPSDNAANVAWVRDAFNQAGDEVDQFVAVAAPEPGRVQVKQPADHAGRAAATRCWMRSNSSNC